MTDPIITDDEVGIAFDALTGNLYRPIRENIKEALSAFLKARVPDKMPDGAFVSAAGVTVVEHGPAMWNACIDRVLKGK